MDAWSTVIGQRTMDSICSIASDIEKIKDNQPTLRDYFAAQVLNGLASSTPNANFCIPEATDWAYRVADAMMVSRKNK